MAVQVVRPMVGRDPGEVHRAATPLELFFDLTFVVAVAQASNTMHHLLVDGHAGDALVAYPMVFFGIWWAWMNFTWFASAYDSDDALYRLACSCRWPGCSSSPRASPACSRTSTRRSSSPATSSSAPAWSPSGCGPPSSTPTAVPARSATPRASPPARSAGSSSWWRPTPGGSAASSSWPCARWRSRPGRSGSGRPTGTPATSASATACSPSSSWASRSSPRPPRSRRRCRPAPRSATSSRPRSVASSSSAPCGGSTSTCRRTSCWRGPGPRSRSATAPSRSSGATATTSSSPAWRPSASASPWPSTRSSTTRLTDLEAGFVLTVPVAVFLVAVLALNWRFKHSGLFRLLGCPITAAAVLVTSWTDEWVLLTGLALAALVAVTLVRAAAVGVGDVAG